MEKALDENQVSQVSIHQNRQVPTGRVSVELKNGEQRQFYVTDVKEVEEILRDSSIDPVISDVPQDSVFTVSYTHLDVYKRQRTDWVFVSKIKMECTMI